MTTDLLACLELVLGHSVSRTYDPPWDGGVEGPDDYSFVSDSDADLWQRRCDADLTQRWGPQV